MGYYIQIDRQGPVDAKSLEEAQKKGVEDLLAAAKRAANKTDPVEALMLEGFSISVRWR